jgi:hypothetical protein
MAIITPTGCDVLGFASRNSDMWRRTDENLPRADQCDDDAEALRRFGSEILDERKRTAAALTSANLAPLDPPPGEWTAVATWRPPVADILPETSTGYGTLRDAVLTAEHLGCARGVRLMRVAGPDGRVHAVWDKDAAGSLWLSITAEAEDDERELQAEALAAAGGGQ